MNYSYVKTSNRIVTNVHFVTCYFVNIHNQKYIKNHLTKTVMKSMGFVRDSLESESEWR